MTRLLVTRPEPQASAWVAALRGHGLDAHALPLLAIEPADAAALAPAWSRLGEVALVVFVSPNAVSSFFAARAPGMTWPPALPAASPGPGSDDALAAAGVPHRIAPPADAPLFDSDALWQRLRDRAWQGQRVLIVRGDGGRDTLAQHLRDAGAVVGDVTAYRRTAPRWSAAQQALYARAEAAPADHRWLLSSTRALRHLPQAPGGRASWRAFASHPRIADAARAAGIGRVTVLRPGLPALLDALSRDADAPRSRSIESPSS